MERAFDVSVEREPVYVEVVREVAEELVVAAEKLSAELRSPNQVPITKEWLEQIVNSDSTLLLAAKRREVFVGLAVLVVYRTLVNPRAILETISVDPDARGLGVGSELVAQALVEARKRKVNTLRLATGKDNAAANALFEKMGGELSPDYNWYDFVLSRGPQS
jgi:ribosomal protein S18 acetylase RimI-like enzyme